MKGSCPMDLIQASYCFGTNLRNYFRFLNLRMHFAISILFFNNFFMEAD